MIDNGKVSTILITITGAILAAVIAQPTLLQPVLGEYYVQYSAIILVVLVAVYNVIYPRNPVNEESEPVYETYQELE